MYTINNIFPFVTTVLARKYGSNPLEFYSVTATIIPVLFLALVYQSRVGRNASPILRYTSTSLGTLFAISGEVFSLRVLAHGYAVGNGLQSAIVWSLVVLGIAIAVDPLIMARNAFLDAFPASMVKDADGHYKKSVLFGITAMLLFIAWFAFRVDNVLDGPP